MASNTEYFKAITAIERGGVYEPHRINSEQQAVFEEKNLTAHTVKKYLHRLQRLVLLVATPIELVDEDDVKRYIDFLLDKGLAGQSINAHLVANLILNAIDYSRSQIFVKRGKGNKDRGVYVNNDAGAALAAYLRKRVVTWGEADTPGRERPL